MKHFLIGLLTFLLMALNAEAEASANIQCTFINNSTQISCDLNIANFNNNINKINSDYTAEDLKLKEIILPNGWITKETTDKYFILENPTSASLDKITFIYEIINPANSYNVQLNNFKFFSDNIEYNPAVTYNILSIHNKTTASIPSEEKVTIGVTIKMKYTSSPYTKTTYPKLRDNTLESLKIKKHNINFIKTLNAYNIAIPKEEDYIDIEYKLTNKNYSVALEGNKNLQIGKNIVSIIIIDNEGNKNIYTINVYRGTHLLDNDATLKSLNINNYILDFNSKSYKYTLNIQNNNKLDISAECNSKTTSYQIYGNDNLSDGSIITIKTIAQDNSSLEYKILIKYDLDIISPYLVYSSLSIIFILSLYILYKKQKEYRINKKLKDLYKSIDVN